VVEPLASIVMVTGKGEARPISVTCPLQVPVTDDERAGVAGVGAGFVVGLGAGAG
jgi:hypothetical protein